MIQNQVQNPGCLRQEQHRILGFTFDFGSPKNFWLNATTGQILGVDECSEAQSELLAAFHGLCFGGVVEW
jgi:hypothetical protein